jgi:hypothetical protein
VGIAVGVVVLLALLAFLVLSRRRSAAMAGKNKALAERAEIGDSAEGVAGPAYEKDGAGVGVKEVNS